jgi:hypothetical protein
MPLAALDIPPGFYRKGTDYQSRGRWFDGSLVRWRGDLIEPIGGWSVGASSMLDGTARGMLVWRDNVAIRYIAIGTNTKLYVNEGGAYADVSPVDLAAGNEDTIPGEGFGAGQYGMGDYGVAGVGSTFSGPAATWSLDTWGENLIAVLSSDGRILEYEPGDTVAAVVVNAPVNNVAALVSNERHLFALGADDNKRLVMWCSQEANTDWTPTGTNTAGDLELETQGNIVTGRKTTSGRILVWTTIDVHAFDYLGTPFIYGRNRIGENCGVLGPNAVVAVSDRAFWMGEGKFWKYDGGVVNEMQCDISDKVWNDINLFQRAKIFAGHNSQFNEVWWFYPSAESDENDSYAIFNYQSGIWYFGALARTCWTDKGINASPLAVSPDGTVYEHETGILAAGATRVGDVFFEAGPVEVGDGERVAYINLVVPDIRGNPSALELSFSTHFTPQDAGQDYGPFTLNPTNGYAECRATGRQLAPRWDLVADLEWSFGRQRIDMRLGGRA